MFTWLGDWTKGRRGQGHCFRRPCSENKSALVGFRGRLCSVQHIVIKTPDARVGCSRAALLQLLPVWGALHTANNQTTNDRLAVAFVPRLCILLLLWCSYAPIELETQDVFHCFPSLSPADRLRHHSCIVCNASPCVFYSKIQCTFGQPG